MAVPVEATPSQVSAELARTPRPAPPRSIELAPGAKLNVRTLLGGIAIKTPPNWRIKSSVKAVAGGVDVPAARDDDDAPVLEVEGLALFGGVTIGAKAGPAATEPVT